jgi:hypothetical protein
MTSIKETQKTLIQAAKKEYKDAQALPWGEALDQLETTMAFMLASDPRTPCKLPNNSAQELMEEIAAGRLPIMLFFVTKQGVDRTVLLPFPEQYDSNRNRVDVTNNKAELSSDVEFICNLVATSVKMGKREKQFGANIMVIQKNLGYNRENEFISWGELDEQVIRDDPRNFPGYTQAIERAVESLS